MHKIIRISLSAALVSAKLSGAAHAAYSPEDMFKLEALVDSSNWVELRSFLLSNPALLRGNDPITTELKKFLDNTAGLYTALVFEPSMFPNLAATAPAEPTTPGISTARSEATGSFGPIFQAAPTIY